MPLRKETTPDKNIISPNNKEDLISRGTSFWEAEILKRSGANTLSYRFCSTIVVTEEYFGQLNKPIQERKNKNKWGTIQLPSDVEERLRQGFAYLLKGLGKNNGDYDNKIVINNGPGENEKIDYDIKLESTSKKIAGNKPQPEITYRLEIHVNKKGTNLLSPKIPLTNSIEEAIIKNVMDMNSKLSELKEIENVISPKAEKNEAKANEEKTAETDVTNFSPR